MTNLDGIFKSRDIPLLTKVHLVEAMVFLVIMYGCESWIVKKGERWRIDAFELWCWRRLLRVPWTARRSNQSILKEISPGCSFEGVMLKLKLQYFGLLMRRVNSLEKTLMLEVIGGRRIRGQQRIRWWMASLTWWSWVWVNSGVGDEQGGLTCCSLWGHKVSDMTEWLNWTEPIWSHGPQPCLIQRNYEPCHVGPPKMDGSWWKGQHHVVYERREWQTTSVFLPWEPHEPYEKAKR